MLAHNSRFFSAVVATCAAMRALVAACAAEEATSRLEELLLELELELEPGVGLDTFNFTMMGLVGTGDINVSPTPNLHGISWNDATTTTRTTFVDLSLTLQPFKVMRIVYVGFNAPGAPTKGGMTLGTKYLVTSRDTKDADATRWARFGILPHQCGRSDIVRLT